MRSQRSTFMCLAVLSSTLLACDSGPKSIGSLDSDTGDTDDEGETGPDPKLDMGQANTCNPPGVSADFEVLGLGEGIHDLSLVCASALSEDAEGYSIALTGCTDEQAMAHPDLEIRLSGDWSEPSVDEEPELEVRYVELPMSVVIDEVVYDYGIGRWLILRNPGGQFPIPLVAVDAASTHPSAYSEIELDYAPLAIDSEAAGCELVEHPECAPIEIGALVVSVDDQPFAVPEGEESNMVGVGSVYYHVLVERTRSLVDDCPGYPGAEYKFGIVAFPNS